MWSPEVELSAKFVSGLRANRKLERPSPRQPALVAGADKCNSACARGHNFFVADVNIDGNAVLRRRICRHAGPYSRSVLAATEASATAVQNAGQKCDARNDMTPPVATSKVSSGDFYRRCR